MVIVESSPFNRTIVQVWKSNNGIWNSFPDTLRMQNAVFVSGVQTLQYCSDPGCL
jgi:hypothetical protein